MGALARCEGSESGEAQELASGWADSGVKALLTMAGLVGNSSKMDVTAASNNHV